MDFDDSSLVFDFEADLEAAGSDSVVVGAASNALHQGRARRPTVCRYWLKGLCIKGESCRFLHEYDEDRKEACRFFRADGFCGNPDCIFKHSADAAPAIQQPAAHHAQAANPQHVPPPFEDVLECSMYNVGFCPNGPCCRHRHVKKPGPPPPAEEVVKKLLQMNSLNYGSSSAQARDNNSNQQKKPRVQLGSVRKSQNLAANVTSVVKQPAAHHAQTENPQHVPPQHTQQQQQHAQVHGVPNGSPDQATITPSPPPQGQSRYSVVKSCNQENLEISVQQGVWASQKGVMMSLKYSPSLGLHLQPPGLYEGYFSIWWWDLEI